MLDDAIREYNNRAIDAAGVVRVMVEMRQQQLADEQRKRDLGLSDEELAFYDVIRLGADVGLWAEDEWVTGLVHGVVRAVHANLKVDWTKPHRKDVYASVESAVKLVLRRRRIKGEQLQFLFHRLMQQAEAIYKDWALVT
jgi:type I restriction enzyme, R subunit